MKRIQNNLENISNKKKDNQNIVEKNLDDSEDVYSDNASRSAIKPISRDIKTNNIADDEDKCRKNDYFSIFLCILILIMSTILSFEFFAYTYMLYFGMGDYINGINPFLVLFLVSILISYRMSMHILCFLHTKRIKKAAQIVIICAFLLQILCENYQRKHGIGITWIAMKIFEKIVNKIY